ncbi:MAG: NAD(P)-binding protein [Novosphingobium sp.]
MLDPAPARPPGVIVVLGAGIAGLAAADRLCRAGWRVRVVERGADVGGFHRACHIGPYTFDAGSIFYEEHARLFDLAPGLRELCPKVNRHQRRIAPDGTIRHYPFTPDEFRGRPFAELVRALIDLLWSRLTVRRNGTVDAISRKRLGRRLFESTGLAAYIARFHHVSPGEIDESFFFHRMAFVARATRMDALARMALRNMFARSGDRSRPPLRHRKHAVSKPW